MKKTKFKQLILLLCFVCITAIFLLSACNKADNNTNNNTNNNIEPTSITLSETNITMSIGESHQLYATVSPLNDNNKVEWLSVNTAIASVDTTGNVTAIANGTALIQAKTQNNLVASCTVTVKQELGNLTIDVTYRNGYNASTLADKNARIVIIPENLQSFPDDFTIYDDHDFSSYGIYLGKTDTDGKKTFNDIPVGKYRVIAQSNVVEYDIQTRSDIRNLTEDGEKVIKHIFGDTLYQTLQDLKNKTKPNTNMNSYSSLAMSLSSRMSEGKTIEIKNTTQSISIAITTI